MRKIMLLAVLLACMAVAGGAEILENGMHFEEVGDGMALVGYDGDSRTLTVPQTAGGKPVTSVAAGALRGNTRLRRVELREGAARIEPGAFADCVSLEQVLLPRTLQTIGAEETGEPGAFEGCAALTAVSLPEGLRSLGARTYSGCASLASVPLPHGLDEIGADCFRDCAALTRIDLPAGLQRLGAGSFSGCAALRDVRLPAGLHCAMEEGVFAGCDALESLYLPEGIRLPEGSVFGEALPASFAEFYAVRHSAAAEYCKARFPAIALTLGRAEHVPVRFDARNGRPARTVWVKPGDRIAQPARPKRTGEAFSCWTDAADGGKPWRFQDSLAPDGGMTLYAVYAEPFGRADVRVPSDWWRVAPDAYAGADFTAVDCGTKVKEIYEDAFSGCRNLRRIRVAKDCVIDKNAFPEDVRPIIYAKAGGKAERFALDEGYTFVPQ